MTFTLLIDNMPSQSCDLHSEHGLSLFCKWHDRNILVDTGLTGKAMDNAKILGIDISDIDILILSHGHNDHTGGLERFLQINGKAKIYASSHIRQYKYESNRHGVPHDISPDINTVNKNLTRFCFIDTDTNISDGIWMFHPKNDEYQRPAGNKYLSVDYETKHKEYIADDEIAIAIKEKDNIIIISPCSHSGLLNTVHSAMMVTGQPANHVKAYIGGLHLLDEEFENDQVEMIAQTFMKHYPNAYLYSSHCTGEKACRCLSSVLNDRFTKFHTGYSYII